MKIMHTQVREVVDGKHNVVLDHAPTSLEECIGKTTRVRSLIARGVEQDRFGLLVGEGVPRPAQITSWP